MRRRQGKRARLGGLLIGALALLALLALPGIAAAKDRNHDHIPDRWEKRHHLSLHADQANRDQDHDRLDNMAEFKAGDNPRDQDTDNDGIMDGEEHAGTITAYDTETGKLTITLFGGETMTGVVDGNTRIRGGHECSTDQDQDENGSEASSSSRGPGDSGSGDDNSGPGQGEDGNSVPPVQGEDGSDDPPGHDGMPGDNQGPGNEDGNGANCSPAALVVGATVSEAELKIENGVATFEEIDLTP